MIETNAETSEPRTVLFTIAGWLIGFLSLIPCMWIFGTWFIVPDVSIRFRVLFTLGCLLLIVFLIFAGRWCFDVRDRRLNKQGAPGGNL
jgi:hypothetical protein